jgi:hypothetical protein
MNKNLLSDFDTQILMKFESSNLEEYDLEIWNDKELEKALPVPRIAALGDDWRFPISFDDQIDDYWYGGTALFYGNLDWKNSDLSTQIIPSMGENGQNEGGVIGLTLHTVKVSPWGFKNNVGELKKHHEYIFNFGGWDIPENLKQGDFWAQFKQQIPDLYLGEFGIEYQQLIKDVFPQELAHPSILILSEAISKALGYCALLYGLRELLNNFENLNKSLISLKVPLADAFVKITK